MAFWIAAIGLSVLVAALPVLAMARGTSATAKRSPPSDIGVYRDQLRELETDLARGTISDAEAEQARLEISRRLLAADTAARRSPVHPQAPKLATQGAIILCVMFVVGGSIMTYLELGAPGYPDMPLQARIALAEEVRLSRPGQAETEVRARTPLPHVEASEEHHALVARLRQVVAEHPDDSMGHMLLARSEAQLGDFTAAHAAQARYLELKGDTATAGDWANYAELLISAVGGYVSPEAEQAINRTLALDPGNVRVRHYSGLMYMQTGRPDLAFRIWSALLRESAPDAPWAAPIRAHIQEAAMLAGIPYVPPENEEAGPAE